MVFDAAGGMMQLVMAFLAAGAGTGTGTGADLGTSTSNTWTYVSSGKQGAVWYVDTASLRDERDTDGQSVRRAIVKTQYADVGSGPAKDIKRLILFNCQEEISKTISYTEYDSTGQETRSYAYPMPAYDDVVPGTVLASAMAKACSSTTQ